MKIIRYVDIVDQIINERGEIQDNLIYSNFTLPMIIDPTRVDAVYPLFSTTGKLFKNVSIIKYDSEMLKVVGNYKYIHALKEGNTSKSVGFTYGQQKQEKIENRTKIKSTTKRRAKRSSK